jgi:hypothetical protein
MGIMMYCRRLDVRNTACYTYRAADRLISAKDVTLIQDQTTAGTCVLVLPIVSRLVMWASDLNINNDLNEGYSIINSIIHSYLCPVFVTARHHISLDYALC